MSWEDRDYSSGEESGGFFGKPGGDWQGIRPSFDNPLTWSLRVGRILGVTIRVHVLFLLYIIYQLLKAVLPVDQDSTTTVDLPLTAIMMASLFTIVLLHEFGHVLACRWVRGQADEILMWPLGGLAFCKPPNRWQAHLVTAVGGPMVNVVLCLVLGAFLGLYTKAWLGVALPNPLDPFGGLIKPVVSRSLMLQSLYMINSLSLLLLLFNLLPIFPLDGGRIVQALLWSSKGYANSMRLAVRTGYIGAILIGLFGLVSGHYLLVGIALFGGITCYMTHKQLAYTEDFMGFEDDEYMLNKFSEKEEDPTSARKEARAEHKAEKEARKREEETLEVDRILQKIADTGMDSLTAREKKFLESHTERKRRENDGDG